MGQQIIKQPNGLYCVFSSVVDHVILYDATAEDIIADRIEEESQRIRESVLKVVAALEADEKPYYQFTMSFDEMTDLIQRHHGKDDKTLNELIAAANTADADTGAE